LQQPPPDAVGGGEDVAVRLLPGVSGEDVEQVGQVGADVGVGGEQSDVLVLTRGPGVVVAAADMAVAADRAPFLAYDERDLAVRLESDESVDDVHPRAFQGASPGDVGVFV